MKVNLLHESKNKSLNDYKVGDSINAVGHNLPPVEITTLDFTVDFDNNEIWLVTDNICIYYNGEFAKKV